MPYVEGESLRQRLDRAGPLPIRDASVPAADISRTHWPTLTAPAWCTGTSSRATCSGWGTMPSLMDFGIAKLVDEKELDGADGPRLRRWATPAYMPPRAAGLRSPRSTIAPTLYAWGTLAHETLTGRLPLPPEKAGEVDTGGVRAHRLELPEPVARLVARCLRPWNRPAARRVPDEIVAALDALGVPTTAAITCDAGPGRAWPCWQWRSLLSLGGFAVWRATRPPPPTPQEGCRRRSPSSDSPTRPETPVSTPGAEWRVTGSPRDCRQPGSSR